MRFCSHAGVLCVKNLILCVLFAWGVFFLTGCAERNKPADAMKESDALGESEVTGEPEVMVKPNVFEETLILKGLGKEKEYELLFITDSHVVVRDERADEAVSAYAEERYLMFHNGEGIDSRTQFEAYIGYANERKVDGVLLGGDIIDSPSEANIAWLAEQFEHLQMPYLYTPGNHDWTYPWEYMTDEGRQHLLPLLEPFMQGNTEINALDFGDFLAVGINDSTNQVSEDVFTDFERLYAQDKPMLVMAHVPFLTQSVLGHAREVWPSPVVIGGGNYGGIYPNENSGRFVDMLTAAGSPVELVLTGHVHFYDRDVIAGEKEVLQLTGAAGYEGNIMLLHIRGAE